MNSIRVRIGVLGLALLAGLAAPCAGAAAEAAPSPTVEEQRLDGPRRRRSCGGPGSTPLTAAVHPGAGVRLAPTPRRGGSSCGQGRRCGGGRSTGRRGAGRPNRGREALPWKGGVGDGRPEPGRRPAVVLGAVGDDAGSADLGAGVRAVGRPTGRAAGRVGADLARADRDPVSGAAKGIKRVLVTGFDPFTLDRDIRISNPSGATALALDGTVIETADGPGAGRDRRVSRCGGRTSRTGRWSGRCGRI